MGLADVGVPAVVGIRLGLRMVEGLIRWEIARLWLSGTSADGDAYRRPDPSIAPVDHLPPWLAHYLDIEPRGPVTTAPRANQSLALLQNLNSLSME